MSTALTIRCCRQTMCCCCMCMCRMCQSTC